MFGLTGEDRETLQSLYKLLHGENGKGLVAYSDEILGLKRQIADLEVSKSKIEEKHEREERELRHMVGLEKKRQEVELEHARREALLSVREENLKADRERFEGQIKFHQEQFDRQIQGQNELLSELMKRLPEINVSVKR